MNKRFLFFLNHPAKFHLFKSLIKKLKTNNHVDLIIINKGDLVALVENENWNYYNILPNGRKSKKNLKILYVTYYFFLSLLKLISYLIKNKRYDKFITDDILVIPGYFLGIKSYFYLDVDFNNLNLNKYLLYFANYIISPSATNIGKYTSKKLSYNGNKSTPYLNNYKNNIKRKYIFIRLSILNAMHDSNNLGINNYSLSKLHNFLLKKSANIKISSERILPKKYNDYLIQISPHKIFDEISESKLFITDSGSMATEAAILGIPNILINNLSKKTGVHLELNKFGLQYLFEDFTEAYTFIENKYDFLIESNLDTSKYKNYCNNFDKIFYNEFLK